MSLTVTDYDDLLTNAIKAISTRFDKETNRELGRTVAFTEELPADQAEIPACCFPVESVTKWETKSNETDGWIEQTSVQYLIRRACVISLQSPISSLLSSTSPGLARVTYTGGYLLPGSADVPSATRLPDDLEQAAVEQVAYWFRNRDKTGLIRSWPHDGTFEVFLQSDLLLEVGAVLKKYERLII